VVNSRCGLLFQILIVDLLRGPVLKSGVPTPRIVPEFNIPHNVTARVLPGRILGPVNALVLQRREERLGHRIVVTDPGTAYGLPEAVLLQRRGELAGRVIAAAIGVKNSILSERVIAGRNLEEVSIGDYVLSGGEIAAMAVIDACVRLLPGVMGAPLSATDESFAESLLEYPHYTRPQVWEGRPIPDVLISGDHAKVAGWRRAEAERLTRERRPDLWAAFLQGFRKESGKR